MDFPIDQPGTITDADFLYRSLGSFWTDVFSEKETLRGYTLAQAEEITQRYIELIEAINSYSIQDIDVLHSEKWKPIQIFKSKLNAVPFKFNVDDAVFGAQPVYDKYYNGQTFSFGHPKTSAERVYQYAVGNSLVDFSVITDKVISPSIVYIYGTDVVLTEGVLVFNKNIFDNPDIIKFDVFDDSGNLLTFIDADGNVQGEECTILWAYNGKSDISNLYNSFGYIFRLKLASSDSYKKILEALINLHVTGPTVAVLKRLLAMFIGTPYVLNDEETIEDILKDGKTHFIITDKEVYKIPYKFTLANLKVGQVMHKNDYLCTNVEFYDNPLGITGWWKRTGLLDKQLAFSKCLFYGNYLDQLSFSTDSDLVTLNADGDIVFPVLGKTEDVTRFNKYLNSNAARKTKIKDVFELVNPGDSHLIIPLDFIMDNFLKQNTAFFKLSLPSHADLAKALALMPLIKSSLPPYIYLIVKLHTEVETEIFENLNGEIIDINFTDEEVANTSADGSDEDGAIQKLAPFYYNSATSRLFEITKALKAQPFETVTTTTSTTTSDAKVISGALRVSPTSGDSTAEFNKFLFLDFS